MDRKTLVDVVKKLNETELTDPIDVKVKEEELKELFGQAVDSVLDNDEYGDTEDERQKKLPEAVRAVYKELFLSEAEVVEEDQPEEKPVGKTKGNNKKADAKKQTKKGGTEMKKKNEKKDEKKEVVKKDKKEKGPGIIDTIIECLNKGPIKKEKIEEVLVKRFPDRKREGMRSTINIQLAGRLAKEKKLKIESTDKGYMIKK